MSIILIQFLQKHWLKITGVLFVAGILGYNYYLSGKVDDQSEVIAKNIKDMEQLQKDVSVLNSVNELANINGNIVTDSKKAEKQIVNTSTKKNDQNLEELKKIQQTNDADKNQKINKKINAIIDGFSEI